MRRIRQSKIVVRVISVLCYAFVGAVGYFLEEAATLFVVAQLSVSGLTSLCYVLVAVKEI